MHFISHMVQIILLGLPSLSKISLLYIPHGSDNTTPVQYIDGVYLKLYIPHGSDNTYKRPPHHALTHQQLYIPHGSDNTHHWATF